MGTGAAGSGKRIILLSDGTGNSSAKLFKTNVWRLYQSLDLGPPAKGEALQIACYNDGVGNSSFRPLALLGGAFGWGLKRNVLQLYEFLCRTWEPGDEIFVFGFSRGAFTARVLTGFVLDQGLVRGLGDVELSRASRDAYRAFRWNFDQTGGLVAPLRRLRDGVVRGVRGLARQRRYLPPPREGEAARGDGLPADAIRPERVAKVAFVGVWDTVAAYGTPVAEFTRGLDEWVWPLSMPDHDLSPRVVAARHALALDDERDTFHPVLWNEVSERDLVEAGTVPPGRLRQVWFAGMHADVGGGYPDDSLSRAPLLWMMDEAAKAGLRFRADASRDVPPPNRDAPRHDSRRGLAGYYRYQPRKIAARMLPEDPTSLIMQDPRTKPVPARLLRVEVHESVLDRIADGTGHYAPIVLPRDYAVVGRDGEARPRRETEEQATRRAEGQEAVWDEVWRRRVNYFLTLIVSALLALLPVIGASLPDTACQGPLCLLSPVIQGVGGLVPAFLATWTEAFARHPNLFFLLVALLVLLLLRGGALERRVHDRMRLLWSGDVTAPGRSWSDGLVRRARTSRGYQATLRWLKWRAVPWIFGVAVLLLGAVVAALSVVAAADRVAIARGEADGGLCTALARDGAPPRTGQAGVFDARDPCWDTGADLVAGRDYVLHLAVLDPWRDGGIATDPLGFGPGRMGRGLGYLGAPWRRSLAGGWFQPFLTIAGAEGPRATQEVPLRFAGAGYVARFRADHGGRAHLWVNDAVAFAGLRGFFYANNGGTARVTIRPAEEAVREEQPAAAR